MPFPGETTIVSDDQPSPRQVPPGHRPPGAPPPPYGAPGAAGAAPPPPRPGAWTALPHKPGVIPLRPLSLGDLYDGAFTTIRRNPRAMVGLAAAVTALFMVVPVALALLLASTGDLAVSFRGGSGSGTDPFGDVGTGALGVVSNLGTLFGALASVVLNGMLVHVVAEAVLGRRTDIGAAWVAARPRLLPLVGLTLLNGLVVVVLLGLPVLAGVLTGLASGLAFGLLAGIPLLLAGVALLVFVQVRFFLLAPPALVLERTGVRASLRRAGTLSRDQFWRLLGISLLTTLVVGLVSQVVAVPLGLLGLLGPLALPGTGGALVLVFSSYLTQVVVGAVTTPFSSAVVALQYVDQRIRKEGLDMTLLAAAGPASPDLR